MEEKENILPETEEMQAAEELIQGEEAGFDQADEYADYDENDFDEYEDYDEYDGYDEYDDYDEAEYSEYKKPKSLKLLFILLPIVLIVALAALYIFKTVIPNAKYTDAIALFEEGRYEEALKAFEEISGFKDAGKYISDSKVLIEDTAIFDKAVQAYKGGDESAIKEMEKLVKKGSVSNEKMMAEINKIDYEKAEQLENEGKTVLAAMAFGKVGDYEDAKERSFKFWDSITKRTNTLQIDHDIMCMIDANGKLVDFYGKIQDDVELISFAKESNGTRVLAGITKDRDIWISENGKNGHIINFNGSGKVVDVAGGWSAAGKVELIVLLADGNVCSLSANIAPALKANWEEPEYSVTKIGKGNYIKIGYFRDSILCLKENGEIDINKSYEAPSYMAINKDIKEKMSAITDAEDIRFSDKHIEIIKKDGSVFGCAGIDYRMSSYGGTASFVQCADSNGHLYCVKDDGKIHHIGSNGRISGAQVLAAKKWEDIVFIETKNTFYSGSDALCEYVIGVKKDGSIVSTGNHKMDFSEWTNIERVYTYIDAEGRRMAIGIKKDGTVIGMGEYFESLGYSEHIAKANEHILKTGRLNISK